MHGHVLIWLNWVFHQFHEWKYDPPGYHFQALNQTSKKAKCACIWNMLCTDLHHSCAVLNSSDYNLYFPVMCLQYHNKYKGQCRNTLGWNPIIFLYKWNQLDYRCVWTQQHYHSESSQQISRVLHDQWSRKGLARRHCSLCHWHITW